MPKLDATSTVDGHVQARSGVLLIGGYVDNSGNAPELFQENGRPVIEFVGVGIGQGILILGLGQSRADGDVLRGLHVQGDALDRRKLGAEPGDHLVRICLALVLRLERNEHPSLVESGGAPPIWAPTEAMAGSFRTVSITASIALDHCRIGDVLRRFRNAGDHAGILLREEALGDDHVEIAGETDGEKHRHQRDEAMPKGYFQSALVDREQAIEAALG